MEKKIRAKIAGISSYVPDFILTNEELSKMVDTSDEWIMSHVGIKERHILKGPGKATSDMGAEAVKKLLKKTGTKPEEIDLLICGTVTPDMFFPATACLICGKTDIKNAFAFDTNSGCCGFIYTLSVGARYIESGRYKKVIIVGADMNSSMVDYTDRATSLYSAMRQGQCFSNRLLRN